MHEFQQDRQILPSRARGWGRARGSYGVVIAMVVKSSGEDKPNWLEI